MSATALHREPDATTDAARDTAMTNGLDAVACAERFIHAIVWAEHTTLWDLLSVQGRSTALSVAMHNGLDRVVAGRIHDDLADPNEREQFLQQLVNGLRRDLRSVELTELTVGDCHEMSEDTVAVELLTPSQIPGTEAWSAGRLILSRSHSNATCRGDDNGGWTVDRLEPRLAGP